MKLLKEGTKVVIVVGGKVMKAKVVKSQGANTATEVICRHKSDDYRVHRDHVYDVTHLDSKAVDKLVKELEGE